MGDINNHGDAAAGATFPVAMYVFIISYRALQLALYSDLLDVFSPLGIVKYASTYM
jgi:hypothetical protein